MKVTAGTRGGEDGSGGHSGRGGEEDGGSGHSGRGGLHTTVRRASDTERDVGPGGRR